METTSPASFEKLWRLLSEKSKRDSPIASERENGWWVSYRSRPTCSSSSQNQLLDCTAYRLWQQELPVHRTYRTVSAQIKPCLNAVYLEHATTRHCIVASVIVHARRVSSDRPLIHDVANCIEPFSYMRAFVAWVCSDVSQHKSYSDCRYSLNLCNMQIVQFDKI